MSRTVTVGLDGSPESRAAAEWAAREAELRGLPLRLVHVWEPVPEPVAESVQLAPARQKHWSERIPGEAAARIRSRHPGVEVIVEPVPGRPMDVLPEVAKGTDLLVLGSRGLGGLRGFLVGSVGTSVIARTEMPVVLVRSVDRTGAGDAEESSGAAPAAAAYPPVVVGVDTERPDDTVIAFAFEEAARRGAVLKAVHGWTLPAYYAYALPADPGLGTELSEQEAAALATVLRPWREKYPDVEVVEESRSGSAARHLVDAARDASLVVVGRRIRRSPFGARTGPVTHAVLHHAVAPVAVVAHD
ncbi:universal stress protein [Streptomyces sp. NPDC001273]|uniref:universal stress protein n=1 Tax=unclassified Streptomyces TaxID=2593676 RepID=UPI0033E52654